MHDLRIDRKDTSAVVNGNWCCRFHCWGWGSAQLSPCLCCSVRMWPGAWSRDLPNFTVSHDCSHSGAWNKKLGTLFLDMLNIKALCFEHGKFYSIVITVRIKAWEASNITLRISGCFVLMTRFSLYKVMIEIIWLHKCEVTTNLLVFMQYIVSTQKGLILHE